MKKHPAFALFKALFDKAAQDPGPVLPTYFVGRSVFHAECKKAGLDIPEGFIAATKWEESIGLPEYCHRIIAQYHQEHGSEFTPAEKGAWKLRQKQKRAKR